VLIRIGSKIAGAGGQEPPRRKLLELTSDSTKGAAKTRPH